MGTKPLSGAHQHLGPINLHRKTIASLGWEARDPWTVITEEGGEPRSILDWDEFVPEVMDSARQREWKRAAKTRKHYKGTEKGVDEGVTKK